MGLLDRLFIYSYALMLRSPARNRPHASAIINVAVSVGINLWCLLLLIGVFSHHDYLRELGKLRIVAAGTVL